MLLDRDPYILLGEQRERWQETIRCLTFKEEARRNFLRRVNACGSVDARGCHLAQHLAHYATLTDQNELEMEVALTALPSKLRTAYKTIRKRLDVLEEAGLIDVLRRGSGNGVPTRVRLRLPACDRQVINERIQRDLAFRHNPHLD